MKCSVNQKTCWLIALTCNFDIHIGIQKEIFSLKIDKGQADKKELEPLVKTLYNRLCLVKIIIMIRQNPPCMCQHLSVMGSHKVLHANNAYTDNTRITMTLTAGTSDQKNSNLFCFTEKETTLSNNWTAWIGLISKGP